ncbi:N-acetyltransferase GCN5 [Achlya hypogyna]|uniref:N-acetyltransferase GCN5 n=1 Tax=Achlya hypogyna TaxID=1202772 RepID=A0A1V9YQB5_ACHHY|nr:N-acetyltransferase GCN5 [Achlya hypogyna]
MPAFREATAADAAAIAAIVNISYRGDSSRKGWTTEADLLHGARTSEAEVKELFSSTSKVIVATHDGTIIGCVNIQLRSDKSRAYLGMFVVRPDLQGKGLGKELLAAAETAIVSSWKSRTVEISVFTVRSELLAFYERRGYKRTGRTWPATFPDALVSDLKFEALVKALQ